MEKPSIGIFVPFWFQISDLSDWLLYRQILSAIGASGVYRALPVSVPRLRLADEEAARTFCDSRNIVAFLMHDSRKYWQDGRAAENARLLELCVPFINSHEVAEVAADKQKTKDALRAKGISVLPDSIADSMHALVGAMEEGAWYVIKPLNSGAGRGVKLLRREGERFFAHAGGEWVEVVFSESSRPPSLALHYPAPRGPAFLKHLLGEEEYTYSPMMIEPYFNDDPEGFSSLRCLVIGGRVVESVRRVNEYDITSNVSNGGSATRVLLTPEQTEIAVAAAQAVGAEYAGVDLLYSGGRAVVGEVNIGPISVFGIRTGVRSGQLLGEHVVRICNTSVLQ